MYKLDLKESLRTIPISRILDIMKPLVGNDDVFKLISGRNLFVFHVSLLHKLPCILHRSLPGTHN